MANITINSELCKSCKYCIGACLQKIVRVSDCSNAKGYRYVEQFAVEKCTGCRLCAIVCREAAIEVYK